MSREPIAACRLTVRRMTEGADVARIADGLSEAASDVAFDLCEQSGEEWMELPGDGVRRYFESAYKMLDAQAVGQFARSLGLAVRAHLEGKQA